MTQHGIAAEERRSWKTSATGEEPRIYHMDFPAKVGPWSYPVEGCPGQAATRTAMRVHFLHRHVLDTLVILVEVNLPHPLCPRCDMLFPWRALNSKHPATDQCARGAEQKRLRLGETDQRESLERVFEAYGDPLKNVTTFKYPGRVLTAGDYDWLAVVGNLGKARNSLGRLSRILSR